MISTVCEDRQESAGQHVDQPHSVHPLTVRCCAKPCCLADDFWPLQGAVAVVEITAHAAGTSVSVQTDGSCTTLTDMGQLVPRSLVLVRLALK